MKKIITIDSRYIDQDINLGKGFCLLLVDGTSRETVYYVPVEGTYKSKEVAKNAILLSIRRRFPGYQIDYDLQLLVEEYVDDRYNPETHELPHYQTRGEVIDKNMKEGKYTFEAFIKSEEEAERELAVEEWLDKVDWRL